MVEHDGHEFPNTASQGSLDVYDNIHVLNFAPHFGSIESRQFVGRGFGFKNAITQFASNSKKTISQFARNRK